MTTAAAPSFRPDALPAVTVPSLLNAGRSPASDSAVVPYLMNSSASKTRRALLGNDLERHDLVLEFARLLRGFRLLLRGGREFVLLARGRPRTSSRRSPRSSPCDTGCRRPTSPSTIIVSTSFASPMRKPSREPGSTCADALMFSCPPAITISASPHLIACAARCVALRPLPQTLPMVIAGTMSATPARIDAWRAGFWPHPAVST